jgi:hypothetical protein
MKRDKKQRKQLEKKLRLVRAKVRELDTTKLQDVNGGNQVAMLDRTGCHCPPFSGH